METKVKKFVDWLNKEYGETISEYSWSKYKYSKGKKYFRIIRTGDTGDLGSLKISVSEFNVLFASTSASEAKTFDFSVESDRHYLGVLTGGFDTFAFTISSGTPTVGNSYTVNDATYRVLSVVSSVAKAERTAGTKEPPTSGT